MSRCCISIFVFTLCCSAALSAQEPPVAPAPKVDCDTHTPNEDRSNPQQLAIRGISCFEQKEYTKALRFYRQAYLIDPSPLLTAAIGRSFQELGYPALAQPYYVNYLNDSRSDPEGRTKITERFDSVENSLKSAHEVQFHTAPQGAKVYLVVDGEHWEEIGKTPMSLLLLDGKYEVVVQSEGFLTQNREFTISAPKRLTFDMIDADSTYDVTRRTWRKRGVMLMVIATPFVAGGATLYGLGVIRIQDAKVTRPEEVLRDQLVQDGVLFKQWGIVAGGVGLTAFITGLVFYLSGKRSTKKIEGTTLMVTPSGIGLSGQF